MKINIHFASFYQVFSVPTCLQLNLGAKELNIVMLTSVVRIAKNWTRQQPIRARDFSELRTGKNGKGKLSLT